MSLRLPRREPPEIQGSGYVVRSLEAARWAFYKSKDFREGCLLAANLGNEAHARIASPETAGQRRFISEWKQED